MTDDERAFVAPCLTLMWEDAPQRRYPLRELFDAARKDGQSRVPVAAPGPRPAALERGGPAGPALAQGGRWVGERSLAWLARFRRLARDCERLPGTLAGLHWLAFSSLMLSNLFKLINLST